MQLLRREARTGQKNTVEEEISSSKNQYIAFQNRIR